MYFIIYIHNTVLIINNKMHFLHVMQLYGMGRLKVYVLRAA